MRIGLGALGDEFEAEPLQSGGMSTLVNDLDPEMPVQNPRVITAIKAALAGTLSRPRDLKPGELQSLGPVHVQMILDRALGYTSIELADKYEVSRVTVSKTLNHPDAQYLLAEIVGTIADRATDPMERLRAHAGEAVNVVVDVMRTADSPLLRMKAAQDILSRAGYGEQRKVEVSAPPALILPEAQASDLRAALEASRRVATIDYTKHLQAPPQVDDGQEAIQLGQPGTGLGDSEASLTARPAGETPPEKDRRPKWAIPDPPRAAVTADQHLIDEEKVA